MAGGTGGHIFPAAAVAELLQAQGHDIRWLGSMRGMEGDIVPKLGFEFCGLPVTAWHGGRLRKLLAPLNMLRALMYCLALFKREKPNVVVGFGGYASAPGAVAAWLYRTPIVLHEQNGVPGLTNSKLAPRANVVLQAFPETFMDNYEVVGNPVRSELCAVPTLKTSNRSGLRKLKVLVLGGSQGAQAINEIMPKAMALLKPNQQVELWLQTGKKKADSARAAFEALNIEATVVEFIDDMAAAYAWSDLVIARSGASTVSELSAVGRYSVLVPYPWHADRQQYKNADWLVAAGAAECIDQSKLTAQAVADRLTYWHGHYQELSERSEKARSLGVRDSAQRIAHVINTFKPEVVA